jgi:hypothetical protein
MLKNMLENREKREYIMESIILSVCVFVGGYACRMAHELMR